MDIGGIDFYGSRAMNPWPYLKTISPLKWLLDTCSWSINKYFVKMTIQSYSKLISLGICPNTNQINWTRSFPAKTTCQNKIFKALKEQYPASSCSICLCTRAGGNTLRDQDFLKKLWSRTTSELLLGWIYPLVE